MSLKVVYVVDDPPPGWQGEVGRITADILRKHVPPRQIKRWSYFICGPTPMMNAMEKALFEMGVPPEKINSERFDMV